MAIGAGLRVSKDAAGIASKVDDDPSSALRLEALHGGGEVLRSVLVELLKRDIPACIRSLTGSL